MPKTQMNADTEERINADRGTKGHTVPRSEPSRRGSTTGVHPISRAIYDIRAIFAELGFSVAVGPELETEWYNFDALNIPKDHPARDMQDTFWIKDTEEKSEARNPKSETNLKSKIPNLKSDRKVLRTHTSPVQIRYMEEKLKMGEKPPYRIIAPGKIFRNEATDATHEAQFFQLEGLYVDKEVSMAHLKGVLLYFLKKFFADERVEVRFRPSYFPFTEPSAEIDMKLNAKRSTLNASRWLEMGGSGLVHPNVLKNVGLDSQEYSGFAFGMGLDRLVMLKYGIPDVRMFYGGDLRLVSQF